MFLYYLRWTLFLFGTCTVLASLFYDPKNIPGDILFLGILLMVVSLINMRKGKAGNNDKA